jgi:hypothetical protein
LTAILEEQARTPEHLGRWSAFEHFEETSQRIGAKTPAGASEGHHEHSQRRGGEALPLEPVAGNCLIHRRALLGSGIAIAGAVSTGVCLRWAGTPDQVRGRLSG